MRLAFGILFSVIIIAMAVCVKIAKNSGKRMGFAAACLLAALILPMAGNGIIIVSGSKSVFPDRLLYVFWHSLRPAARHGGHLHHHLEFAVYDPESAGCRWDLYLLLLLPLAIRAII